MRVRIVEPAVVSFSRNGQGKLMRESAILRVDAQRIPHQAALMGVGNPDRRMQRTRFFDPHQARHFAAAVEGVIGRRGIIAPDVATARQDDCDAGAGHTWFVVV
jgi:hypothetical protein